MVDNRLKFVSPSVFLVDRNFPILTGRIQTMKRSYSALHANLALSVTSLHLRRGAVSHRAAD